MKPEGVWTPERRADIGGATLEPRRAWHFTAGNKLRDGRPIPAVGEWLVHDGPVEICRAGLHASERLIDALRYVPGLTLHRVTCDDVVDEHEDKLVCRRRRIDASRDVAMRAVVRLAIESACLAAWCAGLYLPDLLVALDLADRDDWTAAGAAEEGAAWDAVRSAGAAEEGAAWAVWPATESARDATRAAARADARAAARAAAWTALSARAAAESAAWAAVWSARAAAESTAWAAVWSTLEARAVALLWGDDDDT